MKKVTGTVSVEAKQVDVLVFSGLPLEDFAKVVLSLTNNQREGMVLSIKTTYHDKIIAVVSDKVSDARMFGLWIKAQVNDVGELEVRKERAVIARELEAPIGLEWFDDDNIIYIED